jgi:stress-induced morphogen
MRSSILEDKLRISFSEAKVYVEDLTGGGDHFSVVVVSDDFKDLPPIKRHKLVNDCFKEELKGPIHALTIKTFTHDEFSSKE